MGHWTSAVRLKVKEENTTSAQGKQLEETWAFLTNKHKITNIFWRCSLANTIQSPNSSNMKLLTLIQHLFWGGAVLLCSLKPCYPDMWSARRGNMSCSCWVVHYNAIIRSWEGPLGGMIWLHIFIQARSPWREKEGSFHLCAWQQGFKKHARLVTYGHFTLYVVP